jgi:Protein of unknown function (DUF3040)
VALSMEEQRILDEMERNLAADDPRLASRLGSFGQQRMSSAIRSQQARTVGGVLALALIAAITIMVFVVSPFATHVRHDTTKPSSHASAGAVSRAGTTVGTAKGTPSTRTAASG